MIMYPTKSLIRTISSDAGELVVLTTPGSLLEKVGLGATPTDFGLPDLLVDGLAAQQQNALIQQLVETHLFIFKDGRRLPIVMIPPMVDFVADLFYERTQQAILWKPRGGGGSLAAAILIWLMMVYRGRSFLDMAGSGEQAKRVYEYVSQFWYCVPNLADALLDGDPLQSETRLKNGVTLSCVPASEKAARGKHVAGFVADESCQEDARVGRVLQAAVQGALSEPNFTIVLLSTFHVPFGFFQENWDLAEERGYRRYRWDVYDCIARCTVGLEEATPDDPQALSYCRRECPLTEVAQDHDAEGRVTGERYTGCDGRARTSCGHLTRDGAIKAKMLNAGTGVWEVEHECQRPTTSGMVYDPVKVQAAVVPLLDLPRPTGSVRRALGIDWGRHSVAVLAERHAGCVAIPEGRVFESKPMSDVVEYAVRLREQYGHFRVYADAENAYGNLDLTNAGFEVVPVPFAQRKEAGIENVARFLNHGRLRIADDGDLKTVIRQLLRLHRNDLGKVVKQDDHGPDALMCAMLHYRFEDEFDSPIADMYTGGSRERRRVTDKLLDSCIHDYPLEADPKHGSSMGVSVGSSDFYVVVSARHDEKSDVRKAMFIGRVGTFDELDELRDRFHVMRTLIAPQADPHRVYEWARKGGGVYRVVYLNDGLTKPTWDYQERLVTVDRTYALDAAYDDIESGRWWLMPGAGEIDDGELYAQMKAPKRERDLATGQLRYRWSDTGALDHYRHAHAFDFLGSRYVIPVISFVS
ncbi:MAG: hypothetical protein C0404_06755 [Verrucomicrobia bacterium]|nr:hypothetical protein [Verrucomicrobiota bacterium]